MKKKKFCDVSLIFKWSQSLEVSLKSTTETIVPGTMEIIAAATNPAPASCQ